MPIKEFHLDRVLAEMNLSKDEVCVLIFVTVPSAALLSFPLPFPSSIPSFSTPFPIFHSRLTLPLVHLYSTKVYKCLLLICRFNILAFTICNCYYSKCLFCTGVRIRVQKKIFTHLAYALCNATFLTATPAITYFYPLSTNFKFSPQKFNQFIYAHSAV